ncbi:IclR family transcriptional regulator [Kribbia dieselivorans]|uniref:IclR family transcriptional regulator n=1 Tax=Kribbia dieselivorans TaxID=331526 RepID=UPI000838B8B7|nr:helix-turn-helix domain-containing protein [Kribbia dieselivorans]
MTPGLTTPRPRHRTVDRVATILESAARHRDGMSLTEIARVVDAPVSSVQGLVNGLVATGYLDETERRYTLGAAPYLLNLIAGRPSLGAVPHADLVALSEETGQPAMLAVAVGRNVFYIDSAMADLRFAYLAENHVRRPLLRTSSGWVFLAHMDRRDLWAHLQAAGPEDEQRVEDFLAEMPQIIETGICASEKSSDTAAGVAAAVREAGRVVASVVLIGTREEIAQKRESLTATLTRYAPRWVTA